MTKALPVVFLAALATLAPTPPSALADAAPAPAQTAPPVIYHVITRPLCSELHKHIAPAVGMMLQNDREIAKSPDLFKRYNQAALEGTLSDPVNAGDSPSQNPSTNGDAANGTMNPSQNIALLGMENLISPIANNVISIQTMLDKPELKASTGNADDDKRLKEMRAKLLKALATQQAALDIISGFVDTQQLADIQHSGQEYISAMNQTDTTHSFGASPTPPPGTYNPNYAGLAPNPYAIDLANVPGLTLGYNPVTRLVDALHWTIDETTKRENDAAKAVMESAASCK